MYGAVSAGKAVLPISPTCESESLPLLPAGRRRYGTLITWAREPGHNLVFTCPCGAGLGGATV